MMEHWKSAKELLELFDVDCSRNGAQNFVELAELLGLMMAFPELGVNDHLLTRSYLRTLRMSPLVFWSRMKRDLAPILEAEDITLDALGVPPVYSRTCPALVGAVAAALADGVNQKGREHFREIAEKVAEICRH